MAFQAPRPSSRQLETPDPELEMPQSVGLRTWEAQIEWDTTRRMQFDIEASELKAEMLEESAHEADAERLAEIIKSVNDAEKELIALENEDDEEDPRLALVKPIQPRSHGTRGSGIAPSVDNLFGLDDKPRASAGGSSGTRSSNSSSGSSSSRSKKAAPTVKKARPTIKKATSNSRKGRSGSRKKLSKGDLVTHDKSIWDATWVMADFRPLPKKPVGVMYSKPAKGANPLMGALPSELEDDDILADITKMRDAAEIDDSLRCAEAAVGVDPPDPGVGAPVAAAAGGDDNGHEARGSKRKRRIEELFSGSNSTGAEYDEVADVFPSSFAADVGSGAVTGSAGDIGGRRGASGANDGGGGEGDEGSVADGAKAKRVKVSGTAFKDDDVTARADGGGKKRSREDDAAPSDSDGFGGDDGLEGARAGESRDWHEVLRTKRGKGDGDGGGQRSPPSRFL